MPSGMAMDVKSSSRFKATSYLHQIAGHHRDNELDLIQLDHSYAKPWNAHPFASHAKPVHTLFMSRIPRIQSVEATTTEDVEMIDPQLDYVKQTVPYDVTKARGLMLDCERYVNSIHQNDTADDWEERINRTGWTLTQNRLFNRILKIFHADRLARLTYDGRPNEVMLRRILVDKTAKRFRSTMAAVGWDSKLTQWLHAVLVDNMNCQYLSAYLDVLQTLKYKIPVLIDKMMISSNSLSKNQNAEALNLLLKRPWDPAALSLTHHKLKKLPGNPLLLLAPGAPTHFAANCAHRIRNFNSHLSCLGKVVPVTMHSVSGGGGGVVSHCLESMITAVCNKVVELQNHFPFRPIVLMGWNVGAVIACHVSLVEAVAAVVCFGFPFTGITGKRGDVDDPLLGARTPTLFVIGENSPQCLVDDLEDLRERMKADTGLVVIGGADEHLRLNRAKKTAEGVTQSMVDRCILDEVSDYLGSILSYQLPRSSSENRNPGRSTKLAEKTITKDNRRRKRKAQVALDDTSPVPLIQQRKKAKLASTAKERRRTGQRSVLAYNLGRGDGDPSGAESSPATLMPRASAFTALAPVAKAVPGRRRGQSSHLGYSITPRGQSTSSSEGWKGESSLPPVPETNSEDAQFPGVEGFSVLSGEKGQNAARGISLSIGSLSSLGQLRQTHLLSPIPTNLTATSSDAPEYDLPEPEAGKQLHNPGLIGSLINPGTGGEQMSVPILPAGRSAFRSPRKGTGFVGYSTLKARSAGSAPTSLLINHNVANSGSHSSVPSLLQDFQAMDSSSRFIPRPRNPIGASSRLSIDSKKLAEFPSSSSTEISLLPRQNQQGSWVFATSSNIPCRSSPYFIIESDTKKCGAFSEGSCNLQVGQEASALIKNAASPPDSVSHQPQLKGSNVPNVGIGFGKNADASHQTSEVGSAFKSISQPYFQDTNKSIESRPLSQGDSIDVNFANSDKPSDSELIRRLQSPCVSGASAPTPGKQTIEHHVGNISFTEDAYQSRIEETPPSVQGFPTGGDNSSEGASPQTPAESIRCSSGSRTSKPPFPTIAATRTRRIRAPRFYDF